MSEKLAIHGGRRSVYGFFPTPWHRVKKAAVLTKDVLGMIPRIARGKTTIGDGSKIVSRFEKAFRQITGSEYALAMNSGTATLHSAYFAVGVGPGSEVIVPAYTWHATATPVLQCGATPVFCDIDADTLTADPADIERRITERTRAISVVHVWGSPCEMDQICAIAKRHGLAVVEDCSHAHGAVYKGKPVGTWGEIGCFSLNASKAVDGGEAGVAVTEDPELFDRMLLFGHFGRIQRGQAANTFDIGDMSVGHKFRPHQCAMHLAMGSLRRLGGLNTRCGRAWEWLCDELRDAVGIRPQGTLPGAVRGGFQSFVLVYEGAEMGGPSRKEFVEAVAAEGVPLTEDRYSQINFTYGMLHKAPLFTTFDRRRLGGVTYDPTRPWEQISRSATLPRCEKLCQQLVSLPRLDGASQRYVRGCGRAMKKVLAGMGVVARSRRREELMAPRPKAQEVAAGAGV
jgi:dTDP-4-amino-4,6-dideoxygalactose transaminase